MIWVDDFLGYLYFLTTVFKLKFEAGKYLRLNFNQLLCQKIKEEFWNRIRVSDVIFLFRFLKDKACGFIIEGLPLLSSRNGRNK